MIPFITAALAILIGLLLYRYLKLLHQRNLSQAQLLISMVEALPIGICVTDFQNCVKLCNSEFRRVFSIDRSNVIGRHIREITNGDSYQILMQVRHNYESKHNSIYLDGVVSTPCQSYLSAIMSGEIIVYQTNSKDHSQVVGEANSSPSTALVVQRYLSEVELARKQIEDQAEQLEHQAQDLKKARDEALSATKAKSMFLASMSHEIRTPMNGVMGSVQLLEHEPLTSDQRELVDIVKDASRDLLTIINDILDSAKIESGNLQLAPQYFNLRDMVSSLVSLLDKESVKKGVELLVEIDSDIPNVLYADSTRLRQVLTNLLSNAIKFTNRNGAVVLMLKKELLANDHVRIMFAVSDTGMGIAEHHQKNLFQPFTQASSAISRDFGGTGLGLYISMQLLSLMGSKMEMRSREGIGSVFFCSIEFPLGDVDALRAQIELEPLANKQGASLDVLLVEDNSTNRLLAERMITKAGHRCQIAIDGIDAIEKCTNQKFDVVLMDCSMPKMDGYSATQVIRSSGGPCAKVPIIALTAHVMEEERLECKKAGMTGFIGKPINRKKLLEILEEIANKTN